MSKIVHMATTAVASRVGLNIDQADDLNTGLDELLRLSASESSRDKPFCVRYDVHPDRLEVLAEDVNASFRDGTSKVSRYRRFILEKVADRFEEKTNQGGSLNVLMVKFLKG
ncbi:MAG: hypothetical protein ACYC5F_04055 [Thermoleophilia bacterium]